MKLRERADRGGTVKCLWLMMCYDRPEDWRYVAGGSRQSTNKSPCHVPRILLGRLTRHQRSVHCAAITTWHLYRVPVCCVINAGSSSLLKSVCRYVKWEITVGYSADTLHCSRWFITIITSGTTSWSVSSSHSHRPWRCTRCDYGDKSLRTMQISELHLTVSSQAVTSLCDTTDSSHLIAVSRWDHKCNNRRDRGRLVPQLLGWGTNNVLVPNFLAIIFKKQEILQHVVTIMQDLASEFSKIFRGRGGDDTPGPS